MSEWLKLDRVQHARVENGIKEIIKRASNEDFHTQYTPIQLCQEVVQKVIDQGVEPGKRWLVIANLEFLFVLRAWFKYSGLPLDNLYYASASPRKLRFAGWMLGNENVIQYNYEDIKSWEPGMKFDVIVGNPPYKRNLHLEFLMRCFELLKDDGRLTFVHPGSWLYAQKPGNTLNVANKVKTQIGNAFSEFEIINGNKIFGVGLFGPCVITTIDKAKTCPSVTLVNRLSGETLQYPSSFDVNPFFDDHAVFEPLKNKIWQYCSKVDNVDNHIGMASGPHYVNLEIIGGHISKSDDRYTSFDFYDFVLPKNRRITSEPIKTKGNQKQFTSFKTKDEAQNFLDYLTKTKFAKFTLMIVKIDQHLSSGQLQFTPFFDFSKPVTDEDVIQTLGLTEREWSFIEKHVDEFYANTQNN